MSSEARVCVWVRGILKAEPIALGLPSTTLCLIKHDGLNRKHCFSNKLHRSLVIHYDTHLKVIVNKDGIFMS